MWLWLKQFLDTQSRLGRFLEFFTFQCSAIKTLNNFASLYPYIHKELVSARTLDSACIYLSCTVIPNWKECTNIYVCTLPHTHTHYTHNGIPFNKKESTFDTYNNMDKSQNNFAEWKKLDTKSECIVWFYLYKMWEIAN